ncbi:hypothetical protein F383_36204 [Gossypium arboreum]|uniref:Uncharacterized protein n=1 Tax=Gossypium arboreum TaxID=29729 RepID=A0A0B0Q1G8_GOSAR|nr:hypothetical protein F383_36204 [Gossypium arboreum]
MYFQFLFVKKSTHIARNELSLGSHVEVFSKFAFKFQNNQLILREVS